MSIFQSIMNYLDCLTNMIATNDILYVPFVNFHQIEGNAGNSGRKGSIS